jgi:hypothetical protein
MIKSALRASIIRFVFFTPDLTVGAIADRRFAPHRGREPTILWRHGQ